MPVDTLCDSERVNYYPRCRVCFVRAPSVPPPEVFGAASSDRSHDHKTADCDRLCLPLEPCLKPDSKALQQLLRAQGHLDRRVVHALAQHPILRALGDAIRLGKCVAFPTETVYGLGANARDAEACRNIFALKRRPQSDPLICHVVSLEQALTQVVDLDYEDEACASSDACDASPLKSRQNRAVCMVFRSLASAFWPGPLSLVVRARVVHSPVKSNQLGEEESDRVCSSPRFQEGVVEEVTAGTGMVAVRCPNHPLALGLLLASGVPVAAPSANRFGRISPTSAEHVLKQFGNESALKAATDAFDPNAAERVTDFDAYDLALLDGGACCSVGIESTVVKLEAGPLDAGMPEVEVVVLRRGCISPAMLQQALQSAAIKMKCGFPNFSIRVSEKIDYIRLGQINGSNACDGISSPEAGELKGGGSVSVQGCHTAMEAPGMCLTHYSPSVPTFLLSGTCRELMDLLNKEEGRCLAPYFPRGEYQKCGAQLSSAECVLLDADGSLASCASSFLKYVTLASAEVVAAVGEKPVDADRAALAAANTVFASLHEAEAAALRGTCGRCEESKNGAGDGKQAWILLHVEPLLKWGEGGLAVYDRLFRAASGQWVTPCCIQRQMAEDGRLPLSSVVFTFRAEKCASNSTRLFVP